MVNNFRSSVRILSRIFRTIERNAVSVLPRIEREDSDDENVCMIKNECVEGTEIVEGRRAVVERVKKEFETSRVVD